MYCVVLMTVPTEQAESLARDLVEKKLAACVNLVPKISSLYRWQGKMERSEESLMIVKTDRDVFEKLEARVVERHPYSVPEILCLPIETGHQPYLDWIGESLKGSGKK